MTHPHTKFSRCLSVLFVPIIVIGLMSSLPAAEPAEQVLTVERVRDLALEYNREYLTAMQEVKRADAEIVKARAGALPDISATAGYIRNFYIPTSFVTFGGQTQEFQFGFKNSFNAAISLRQPIWQGGKVFTAWQIAKLYKRYSRAGAQEVKSDVLYNAEVLFYQVILQRSRLSVLEKALEANTYNLEVIEKMYGQGMVSEYEVLRARVEKNNLLPEIIAAESDVELSEKRLKSFLGMDLNSDVELAVNPNDTLLAQLRPLDYYLDTALTGRPAMQQADLLTDITNKAVRVAQGDYYPSLDVVSAYQWTGQSDAFTMAENNSRSLTAGLEISIPIFRGFERGANVQQGKVDYNQAQLSQSRLRDDIRLQVEEAYDRLVQAKKALDIQGANIAEAEEGLKIANVRYESGVGTLLEVLSAQVALTDARNARAAALFSFREARARLERASTIQLGMN